MSDLSGILWLVVLLAINAFFVAAEFAVIAARRSQIEPRAEAGSRWASISLYAMERATAMLATTQLGITVCSLLILNVSEPAVHHLLAVPLDGIGLSDALVAGLSFAITLAVVSYLHVVVGEMVPKNLSFTMPDRAVLVLAPPLVVLATIARPIVSVLNAIANGAVRLAGIEPRTEAASAFSLDEVATIVATSTKEGVLSDRTGALSKTFEFTEQRVRDVALPVAQLVTLPEDASPRQVEEAVREHGFSRYVLVDDAGEPSGYVHLKDVIDLREDEADEPVPPKRIRQLVSLYEASELEDALAWMRGGGRHLARVFNERGDTTGVLFLEDILEVLVGEVEDATRRD